MTPVDVKETRAFDASRPFRTRDGRKVSRFESYDEGFSGHVNGDDVRVWFLDGSYINGQRNLDLVNVPDDPAPIAGGDDLSKPFKPCVVSFQQSGVTEFMQEDVPCVWREYEPGVSAGYAMDDGRLVGMQWPLRAAPLPTTGEGDAVAVAARCHEFAQFVSERLCVPNWRPTRAHMEDARNLLRKAHAALYAHQAPAPRHDGGTVDEAVGRLREFIGESWTHMGGSSLYRLQNDIRTALAAHPAQHDHAGGEHDAFVAQCWQTILDFDDRTSPEEYPDHALIDFDEFKRFMDEALDRKGARS